MALTKITTSVIAANTLGTANIADNRQVANAKIFYKKSGESDFKSINMTASGNTYTGNIPSSEVTQEGLEYFLTATDSSDNIAREPTSGIIPIQVNITGEGLVKSSAQPAGSEQNAYR